MKEFRSLGVQKFKVLRSSDNRNNGNKANV